jgi:GlpG protein
MSITIGRINNHRAALAFCDYLAVNNIPAKILDDSDGHFLISIEHPDDEDFACAAFRDFLANPNQQKYLDASWQHGQTQYKVSTNGTSSVNLKQFLQRAGFATKLFVAISVLVTLITGFGEQYNISRYLFIADVLDYQGALVEIKNGQLWRLVTPIFMHFMIIHILFNMMWLWDLGGTVERIQSTSFLVLFIISSGILSNLVQYLSSGPAFGGMSGVVYALLGYTWIRSRQMGSGYNLSNSIVGFMLIWLALGFTGYLGPIGNAAHLSGLIIGMAYGLLWNIYAPKR